VEGVAVVISGLPASGKTSLGRIVSRGLGLPCLDKDDFLEALYEREGVGDWDRRQSLNRKADTLFRSEAERLSSAVLVSHWRPRGIATQSGAPTEWIGRHFRTVVEVHCACSASVAAERFFSRTRHPGHLDSGRDRHAFAASMREMARWYPLGIGQVVTVPSGQDVEPVGLVDLIRSETSRWPA